MRIIKSSRSDKNNLSYTVNSALESLEDEYQFMFSHPDIEGNSVEFYYGIDGVGDCQYYVDDELNPDLFDMISDGNIADAVEMLRSEIISNYVQDYGPLDTIEDVNSATNTSGIADVSEPITAEEDSEDDYLDKLYSEVEAAADDMNIGLGWKVEDSEIYLDATQLDTDKVVRFTIPRDDLSFDLSKIDDDVKTIVDAMKSELDISVESSTNIEARVLPDGTEYDEEDYADDYTEWEEVASKLVRDSDGFMTDYTMWYNEFEDKYVFVFGDKDIYYPENSDWDWECENFDEAQEWFDDYEGFEDDDDIYNCKDINASDELVEPTTASWVVRRMYNKFPECEFLDERDMGDDVALFFKLGGDVGKVESWLNQIKNEYGLSYKIKDGKLRIIAPEDDYTIDECQTIESSTDESEKPYIVRFGWDSGGPENGPSYGYGEDLVYALSEEDACAKWEAENEDQIAGLNSGRYGGYEGCFARPATEADLKEMEEEEAYWDELEKHYDFVDGDVVPKSSVESSHAAIRSSVDTFTEKMFAKFPKCDMINKQNLGSDKVAIYYDISKCNKSRLIGWLDDEGIPHKEVSGDLRVVVKANSSIKTSEEFFDKNEDATYWYFTTHGVMPGSVPRGLEILDVIDKPEGSYFLTNKVLTTDSLKYYDIKERSPR